MSPITAQVVVVLLVLAGLWVLNWGLPCAQRYRLPWRWRVGILAIRRGLIFLLFRPCRFGNGMDSDLVCRTVTFVTGIKRLAMANVYRPDGSFRHPYDLGWIMRPRPPRNPNPTASDVLQDSMGSRVEDK